MPERPIILFGEPNKSDKSTRGGGTSEIHRPSHSRQSQRLTPMMSNLQRVIATLTESPSGIESERTLVFDVSGSVDNFYTAIKRFGDDADWIFDIPEDFEADDDFYELKSDKTTRKESVTTIGGKVYCVLSNVRAMNEIYTLWEKYSKDKSTIFPYGKTALRDVFDNLHEMRFWGYKERIEETGILQHWQADLQDSTLGEVQCEFELFYRTNEKKRGERELNLSSEIKEVGGKILSSCVIPEIAYHAVLASIPRGVAESLINGNKDLPIVTADQVMFFRPVGQAIVSTTDNAFDSDLHVPATDDILEEPIIALFDGLPQENHPYLQGRLLVDDPDNYASGYIVEARKHGTSMASIISLGDLSEITHVTTRKLYVRPIMKPFPTATGYREELPGDSLLVDKIHVAVRRLFEEDGGRVAPSVKVINLSIGISYRQFDRLMSPLARLLDWISFKYRVLFIVSAGNHIENIDTGITFSDFCTEPIDARDKIFIQHSYNESRNLRLLSPAESVNALTVGTTFEDASPFTPNARQILPCSDGLPAPFSSIGMGMNNAVKPDIIYSGGRSCVSEDLRNGINRTFIKWLDFPTRGPGIASAAPSLVGGSSKRVMYSFGTSNSSALISHESSRCYDTLIEVFQDANKVIPEGHIALLLKAMLIHGSEWGTLSDKYAETLGLTTRQERSNQLHRVLGYGKPDVERAVECAKNRITLIGYGDLKIGDGLQYDLPLPFDFSSKIRRRLTATLTYFPTFVATRQKYRAAQLWFIVENGINKLLDARLNIDWQAALRGSVQHEIFENDSAVVWDEEKSIQIKVNCRGDADDKLQESIPYALMVSFEIKDKIDIDVYTKVASKIATKVSI